MLFHMAEDKTLLPGAQTPASASRTEPSTASTPNPVVRKPAPNYKVRMDPLNRTLESMIVPIDPSQLGQYSQIGETGERPSKRRGVDDDDAINLSDDETVGMARETLWDAPREEPKGKEIAESVCEFTSIRELRKESRKRGLTGESSVIRGDEAETQI